MGLAQVAENARLSGQLEDGFNEQLKYPGILHDILHATPDVQENVYEIFGAPILVDWLGIAHSQHTCISTDCVSLYYIAAVICFVTLVQSAPDAADVASLIHEQTLTVWRQEAYVRHFTPRRLAAVAKFAQTCQRPYYEPRNVPPCLSTTVAVTAESL